MRNNVKRYKKEKKSLSNILIIYIILTSCIILNFNNIWIIYAYCHADIMFQLLEPLVKLRNSNAIIFQFNN